MSTHFYKEGTVGTVPYIFQSTKKKRHWQRHYITKKLLWSNGKTIDEQLLKKTTELIVSGKFQEAKTVLTYIESGLEAEKENNFAILCEIEGDIPGAYSHYLKALQIDPENSIIKYNFNSIEL